MCDKGGAGFSFPGGGGGGSIEPFGRTPPQKGSIQDPQNPTETDPRASEVTQTQKSGEKRGIFGISVSRGFRKVIICHTFGEKKIDPF